jgi:hypothetical protein
MIRTTEKIKVKKSNRNWIRPPNTIVHPEKGNRNSPNKLSYWTDANNKAKLYTKEQLATCNILMSLNQLLIKALILLDTLKTLDEDTTIRTLIHQDFARFEATKSSAFDHFIKLTSAVPDITFGEFLGFISPNSNPQDFIKMGNKTLKQVIQGKNTDITNFYTTDRVKKS